MPSFEKTRGKGPLAKSPSAIRLTEAFWIELGGRKESRRIGAGKANTSPSPKATAKGKRLPRQRQRNKQPNRDFLRPSPHSLFKASSSDRNETAGTRLLPKGAKVPISHLPWVARNQDGALCFQFAARSSGRSLMTRKKRTTLSRRLGKGSLARLS